MDTTVIFTLVLSAFFVGGIIWIVLQSRHERGAAERTERPASSAVKDMGGPNTGDREKTV